MPLNMQKRKPTSQRRKTEKLSGVLTHANIQKTKTHTRRKSKMTENAACYVKENTCLGLNVFFIRLSREHVSHTQSWGMLAGTLNHIKLCLVLGFITNVGPHVVPILIDGKFPFDFTENRIRPLQFSLLSKELKKKKSAVKALKCISALSLEVYLSPKPGHSEGLIPFASPHQGKWDFPSCVLC